MTEFIALYRTQARCRADLVTSRWPGGFVCPDCGHTGHCTFVRKGCSTGSARPTLNKPPPVSQAIKLPLTCWFLAMHLLTQAQMLNNLHAEFTRSSPRRSNDSRSGARGA